METVLIALLGGLVPSLVWLMFWLLEDRCQPEPRWRIIVTFLSGMAAVGIVLPIETETALLTSGTALLICWAATEELFKLGAASLFGLESIAYDEPLDAVIYLTTAALGFAAAENALYLFSALGSSSGTQSLLTGDLRFIGATLLHTLASSTIGICMAFFFYYSRIVRTLALVLGVILAVALHTSFNFFILWVGGAKALVVFLPIWLGIVALLAFVEKIKAPERDYC